MRPTLVALLLLLPVLFALLRGSVCQHAARSGLNATQPERNLPSMRTSRAAGTEKSSSGANFEETKARETKEMTSPQLLVGDSGRAAPQVKKPAKSESGKKNNDKQKKKGDKGKKKKKKSKNPCEGEFKKYCVHGECKYIENLPKVKCICHQEYDGERCVQRTLKIQKNNLAASHSNLILVMMAVALSVLSFGAIVTVVIMKVRKKCLKYDEKEEKKKLRQENGPSSNDV